ncbi:MAG TPA: aldo/keto reductase [Symbiobacteriaceae bacterium]|jgi:predicted aldo/keto reductase-like oxidoreductase
MEYRALGQTRERLSIIGFGGIVVAKVPQAEADQAVSRAVEHGINYFDVAPSYDDAEARLGAALEPYRSRSFLACKTTERTRQGARAELEHSLRRLRTSHFDLYQLHAMSTEEDLAQALGPGGALETLEAARKEGLVRFLGFSAHSDAIALKLIAAYNFDTILFPINWVNYHQANFGPAVIDAARPKGMGRLALKAMARSRWQQEASRKQAPKCWYEPCLDPVESSLALRFALSEPITAAIPPGDPELFWNAVETAERFEPLSFIERDIVRQRAINVQPLFPLAQ